MIRVSTCLAAIAGTPLVLAAFGFEPSLAQPPAAATVVLTGARLIDGTGRAPLEQATLVITNGRVFDPAPLWKSATQSVGLAGPSATVTLIVPPGFTVGGVMVTVGPSSLRIVPMP